MNVENITIYSKRRPSEIPYGAIYVGRPTIYGNPFTSKDLINTKAEFQADSVVDSIDKFTQWITHKDQKDLLEKAKRELSGKDLVCWCSSPTKPAPCHAYILQYLVNQDCEKT